MAPGVIQPNLIIIDQNTNIVCASQQDMDLNKSNMKNGIIQNSYIDKCNELLEPTTNLIHRSVRNDVNEVKIASEENGSVKILDKRIASDVNEIDKAVEFTPNIRWPDLIVQTFLHTGAVYGLFLLFYIKFFTVPWSKYCYLLMCVIVIHLACVLKMMLVNES